MTACQDFSFKAIFQVAKAAINKYFLELGCATYLVSVKKNEKFESGLLRLKANLRTRFNLNPFDLNVSDLFQFNTKLATGEFSNWQI